MYILPTGSSNFLNNHPFIVKEVSAVILNGCVAPISLGYCILLVPDHNISDLISYGVFVLSVNGSFQDITIYGSQYGIKFDNIWLTSLIISLILIVTTLKT